MENNISVKTLNNEHYITNIDSSNDVEMKSSNRFSDVENKSSNFHNDAENKSSNSCSDVENTSSNSSGDIENKSSNSFIDVEYKSSNPGNNISVTFKSPSQNNYDFKLHQLSNMPGFKCIHINTHSLLPHMDEIRYLVMQGNIDCLSVNETWLDIVRF